MRQAAKCVWIINSFTGEAIANPFQMSELERCSHWDARKANVLDEEQSQQFCRAALIAFRFVVAPLGNMMKLRGR